MYHFKEIEYRRGEKSWAGKTFLSRIKCENKYSHIYVMPGKKPDFIFV